MHLRRLASLLAFVPSALLAALLVAPLATPLAAQQPLVGTWQGTLDAGPAKLRLAFHVTLRDGALHATLDSIDQGAEGLPVDEVTLLDGAVHFAMPRLGATFDGTLDADGARIVGEFRQGTALPLTLAKVERADAVVVPKRPQHPAPPFPYRCEDVTFAHTPAGAGAPIRLAGTLTLPEGPGPFPAAVLISGSGPQDRDETLLGHKPFLVLADDLTRHGFAVLRYDDRGTAKSTGDHATATSLDFADDARAAVRFLRARPEIDGDRVGLIGHSEGGLIAPIVAAGADEGDGGTRDGGTRDGGTRDGGTRDGGTGDRGTGDRGNEVAFVVLLAGPGVNGREILRVQSAAIARAEGMTDEDIAASAGIDEQVYDAIEAATDDAALAKELHAIGERAWTEASESARAQLGSAAALHAQIARAATPWFRCFLTHDPAAVLRRVRCPVLAMNGALDLQVVPAQNLPAVEAALKAGVCEDITCVELPGLNHLFQECGTGAPSEYQAIEQTFAPAALATLRDWLLARFAK
ncbi:MAG: alpha/beta hydrolase family protein [Planctomycetota bacterium]